MLETLQAFIPGIYITLSLTVLSLSIGLILAISFVYLLKTENKIFTLPINAWIGFSRGVPLLVQIFLLYYGAPQFDWVRNSILWPILQEPFACTLIVLTLSTAAYTAVLLKGAVDAIPKGEIEACNVLNMSYTTKMRYVIFKRALISAWPSYANEIIIVLKSTALASTITLMDITGVMRQVIAKTYEPTLALWVAAGFYLGFSALFLSLHYGLKKKLTII